MAAMIASATLALGQTTVTTDPVGYHTITISPGTQTLGLPLLRPVAAAGGIQSNTATVITASGTANIGALLVSGTPYYLEVTGTGTNYPGERFDVNVDATITSATNTITINGTSSNNTIAGNLPDLSGNNFVIRPHHTLGSVFGTKANPVLTGSSDSSKADQVQLFNTATQGFDIYYFYQTPTLSKQEWRAIGSSGTCNNVVIPPGTGVFVLRRDTTPVTITMQGDVRTTSYHAQPLSSGFNFVAEAYPVDRSPSGTGIESRNLTAGSATGSSDPQAADQVHVWNGAGFDVYYYYKTVTKQQWRKLGNQTDFSASKIFTFDKGAFIKRINSDAVYAEPKPF